VANIEMTLGDLAAELRCGSRVILQVRHAERPKMDPKDPTFGDALPLTAEGERTARLLGVALKEFTDDVQFFASPLRRTRMTAALIAEGMGVENPDITVDGLLGNESFYYKDAFEVLQVFTPPENFFPECFKYMDTGSLRGFNDLAESSDALEEWLLGRFKSRLMVVATHDLYIAAFLASRGAYTERSRETWPRFLDAAAIIVSQDGSRRYSMVRTKLSNGIVGVKV
jgi:broad specificity phosphatase PhoE